MQFCVHSANWKWFWRIEALLCGIGLLIPVLQFCFTGSVTRDRFMAEWVLATVYGNSMGWLMHLTMPKVFPATDRLPWAPRWLLRMSAIGAATAIGCLIGGVAAFGIYHEPYWATFVPAFRLSLVMGVVGTLCFVAYERVRGRLRVTELQLRSKELERERALKLATQARLASLESRIHPHFLFNTINSVSSLIHEDPDRAERLLIQMASLLRFSLDSAQAGLVPLDREITIVKDYLEIETARFDGRLRYGIDVPPELAAIAVPPLSLQTLVENSVKYAVGPRRSGGFISVRARAREASVTFEVSDDGPGFQGLELPAGHGLSNLQERLYALFGDDAALEISSVSSGASVCVRLPLTPALAR